MILTIIEWVVVAYVVIMAVLVIWFAVLLIMETRDYAEQKRIEREEFLNTIDKGGDE